MYIFIHRLSSLTFGWYNDIIIFNRYIRFFTQMGVKLLNYVSFGISLIAILSVLFFFRFIYYKYRTERPSVRPYIAVIVAAALISLFASSTQDLIYELDTDAHIEGYDPLPEYDEEDKHQTLYYYKLNPDEKRIYQAMLETAQEGKENLSVNDLRVDMIREGCKNALAALTYDHPEMFWLEAAFTLTSIEGDTNNSTANITLSYYDYWNYTVDKNKKKEELKSAVEAVAEKAAKCSSHYGRIKFVHDYLIENAYYDYDSLAEYERTEHDPSCEYIYSAYGCLINGRTVCVGYAKAFQLIMNELGYGCMYVTGDAGGSSHAWNCVFIEGEGYYVDVTWDDNDYINDEAVYEYFCITTDQLEITHKIDNMFRLPKCESDKYNYYKYNGYFVSSYTYKELFKIIRQQSDRHVIGIQFASEEDLEKAYNDLFYDKLIYSILPFAVTDSISSDINKDHLTLTLYVE